MPLSNSAKQRLAIAGKIAKKRGVQTLFTLTRPPLPTGILSDFRTSAPTLTQRLSSEQNYSVFEQDDFQAIGSSWLVRQEGGVLADDMGLGKTKMTLDAMMYVGAPGLHLIVCAASNVDTWADEWMKFYPDVPTLAYRGTKRGDALANFIAENVDRTSMIIVSYDTFRADYELLCQGDYEWCVLDEGHMIRGNPLNHMSKIAQCVHHISAKRKYILTGTPIMKTPADCWNLMRWLGKEELEWDDFLQRCCIVTEIALSPWSSVNKITDYTGYGNAHIKNLLHSNMIRRLKGDILHLPSKTYHELNVRMSTTDAYEYKQLNSMYNKMTRMIAQGERAEIPPAVIQQKMLELTASTKYKLDKVEQLVREATDAERKVIVFATRLSTLRFIHERLNKFGLVWITGKVSTVAPQGKRSERQLRVDAFQNDPKKRVLIATQQSCRVGLTLTAASVIVRVAREWNPSDNEQAVARIDRAGQTSAMDIYDLYAVLPDGTDTVERTHVKRALDMKSRRADGIIKGQHSRDKPD